MTHRTYLKAVKRAGYTDAYLSVVPTAPVQGDAALSELFLDVAAAAARSRVQILQEKVFGVCADASAILAARARAFAQHGLDFECPPTFVDGAPCIGGQLAGVQIVGVTSDSPEARVTPLHHRGARVGRELRIPAARLLFYGGVSGWAPEGPRGVADQADRMFENARALLEDQGLTCKHIVRTWIYMPRLLAWYGEFNRVRTACFRRFGIIGPDGPGILPASTGIQGKRRADEECYMDVLAIANDAARYRVVPMRNSRQNEAYEYGSSFSRGMATGDDDRPTLWLSGTASINEQGKTTHHGDEQGQVLETLLSIAPLLESHGAKLRDLCQATAYCRDHATYRVFERIVAHLDLNDIPFVPVIADVCRDELLFEVDSVAVKGAR
ncbi:MAG: hypothetical protein HY908_15430 [Myxococcales bacterium]|nr:hypothetical protein [Myxococcales bacterium]